MRMRFATTHSPRQEDTPKVKAKTLGAKVEVSSDGEGLISHAGAFLLTEMADRLGLTDALSKAMAPTRQRRSAHDPGVVLRDLCVAIADGGDCVTDLGVLAGQQDLFGAVASTSTAHRVIDSIDAECLEAIRAARAKARKAAWSAGARPEELILDIDASLLTCHSDKEGAAGNFKRGFGFHPLFGYLDGGEAPAALLRPGNAGSNTAADHFSVLGLALEQIPDADDPGLALLVRCDGGGATHAFTADCREAQISFSVGYELSPALRQALLELPESAWDDAIETSGEPREGAWVAELTDLIDLGAWPEGSRLICRRERAHPGAQMSFTDHDGHRFTAFLTDTDGEITRLELRHRRRARVEDSIRAGKDTGMRNLPFADFQANEAWLELSLIAQDLLAWAKALVLDGALALAEPKRLRQRLFHVAGRIVRSGRRIILRLPRSWPWAEALVAAFERLRALPAPSPP